MSDWAIVMSILLGVCNGSRESRGLFSSRLEILVKNELNASALSMFSLNILFSS